MLDTVWRLRRYRGKCVEYQGKPYMLLGAHYKKIGTEEVFGEEHDVVEAYAEILVMGTSVLKYVPAEEVSLSDKKWDYEKRQWVERSEQLSVV